MLRAVLLASLMLGLSACGLGESAGAAAAGGVSKAEEVKAARETQERVEQRLQDAQDVAAEQRRAAEDSSE